MKSSTTGLRLSEVRAFRRELLIAVLGGFFSAVAATAQTYEVVHRFLNSEATVRPNAASQSRLIVAPDGYFYGTTHWGGESGFGTVYRMDSAGTTTTLHSFAFADGANPAAGLVRTSNGAFYGTTSLGGSHNEGTVFRMDASGAVTRLHSFDGDGGEHPLAALIEASDGKLYGTTSEGGANGVGVVFRIDSSGTFEVLHSFDRYVDGAHPVAELVEARGAFYGTTREGGANNVGTIFRMDLAGSVTNFHAFAGADGLYPVAALISSVSGDLFGTTSYSGAWGPGLVYRIDMADQMTTLHNFNSETEGAIPLAPLAQGSDGNFYGTLSGGGYLTPVQYGTVFRLTDTGTLTVLHAFDGANGTSPATSLVQTSDGSFYGLTNSAYASYLGLHVAGSVFRIDANSGFATLHRFGWRDGSGPGFLLPASDGFLYGATAEGGAAGNGMIFRMNLSGDVTTLHDLEAGPGGPEAARLMQAADGAIYGTDNHGANAFGRIFRLESTGDVTTLHDFTGNDGGGPTGLTEGSDGKLYGTTKYGGGEGSGAFFRVDAAGVFEALESFSQEGNYLASPNGPLVGGGGTFYGTTEQGGRGVGAIFKAREDGSLWLQYGLELDGSEGAFPTTPLTDTDGPLWGTTSLAGEFGWGTAFTTGPDSAYIDVRHSFTSDEGSATSLSSTGGLYGATGYSSQSPKGTIFSMDESGSLTYLYTFPGQEDGQFPTAPVRASDGFLYGTAGLIYRFSNATVAVNQILPTSGSASGAVALIVIGGGLSGDSSVTVGGIQGTDLTILDSTFLYLFTPALSSGTLNDVSVSVPAEFANATATKINAFFADFLDVPQTDPFHDYVEKIFRAGITAGCGGGSYCSDEAVTRAQMAVFLLKAEHGLGYAPPPCQGHFADVTCPSQFANWIEQLAAEGITAGCGSGNYCPSTPVTRAQMAVFLLKAEHGPGYVPPACTGVFGDVSCPSLFADWIEQLAAEEITSGCGGGNYCPEQPEHACPDGRLPGQDVPSLRGASCSLSLGGGVGQEVHLGTVATTAGSN